MSIYLLEDKINDYILFYSIIITHKKYLSSTGRDMRNTDHTWKKSRNSVKFSRNFTEFYDTEFGGIVSQFRTEYGIDGSKKKQTEFRGHPILYRTIYPFARPSKTKILVVFNCEDFVHLDSDPKHLSDVVQDIFLVILRTISVVPAV